MDYLGWVRRAIIIKFDYSSSFASVTSSADLTHIDWSIIGFWFSANYLSSVVGVNEILLQQHSNKKTRSLLHNLWNCASALRCQERELTNRTYIDCFFHNYYCYFVCNYEFWTDPLMSGRATIFVSADILEMFAGAHTGKLVHVWSYSICCSFPPSLGRMYIFLVAGKKHYFK